jgi:hypothetical protein
MNPAHMAQPKAPNENRRESVIFIFLIVIFGVQKGMPQKPIFAQDSAQTCYVTCILNSAIDATIGEFIDACEK